MNKQSYISNSLEAEIGQEFEGRGSSASQAALVDAIKMQLRSDLKTRKWIQIFVARSISLRFHLGLEILFKNFETATTNRVNC